MKAFLYVLSIENAVSEMIEHEIARKVKDLPGPSKRKVLAYIETLEKEDEAKKGQKGALSFAWEGCLASSSKNKTAIDLQHAILEWH
nr:DUF2281 domain-containing protein [Candidatus Sigynarchaeota archaeon]